jgi:hypothetical protein
MTTSTGTRQARRLRMIAVIVLLLGLAGECLVYWNETHSAGPSEDPAMSGNEKAVARQKAILYGNQAVLVDELTNALRQPGTQAFIILGLAALLGGGCLYFARLLEKRDHYSGD